MKPESLSLDLESISLTPELLAQHSITPDEYQRIVATLGRDPGLTELLRYRHDAFRADGALLMSVASTSISFRRFPGG